MITSNRLPYQLLMLSIQSKACKLYMENSDSYENSLRSSSQMAKLVLVTQNWTSVK